MGKINRYLYILLFSFLLLPPAYAGFTRTFMTMQIVVNEDGSATIRNDIRFYMDSPDSIDLYKLSLKTTNDIAGWRQRLGLNDIRYYVDTAKVQIEKVTIQAYSPDTCNFDQTACYGTLSYEYKIKPPTNATGLVKIEKYIKPRVIRYSLNTDYLSFETSAVGEKFIPERTSVEIVIPQDSINVKMSPMPVEYIETIPRGANKFTWQGRLVLTNSELIFERKVSLMTELVEFFNALFSTVVTWVFSLQGIIILVSIVMIWVGYYLLKQQSKK
ncbi:MAG: hypothetical protein N3G74_01435 [Candidatus Micrarchaeota archaeon]|nr:hypothetical protein [Candidatus Micrarchaeota archaeon]